MSGITEKAKARLRNWWQQRSEAISRKMFERYKEAEIANLRSQIEKDPSTSLIAFPLIVYIELGELDKIFEIEGYQAATKAVYDKRRELAEKLLNGVSTLSARK